MALSYVEYTGNGSTKAYNLTFGYLSRSHVFAFVNNALAAYKWISGTRIELISTPPEDAVVRIARLTDRLNRVTTFEDGQTLLAGDLNAGDLQNFYILQEIADGISDAIMTGAIQVNNPGTGYITEQWIQDQLQASIAGSEALQSISDALGQEVADRVAALIAEAAARAEDLADEAAARATAIATAAATEATERAAAIAAETADRVAALNAIGDDLAAEVAARLSGDEGLNTLIVNESETRETEDEALATQINSVAASVVTAEETLTALVASEATARATADEAEAEAREIVQAEVVAARGGQTNLNARIVSVDNARASGDAAEASARALLTARVDSVETDIASLEGINAGTRLTTAEGSIATLQSVVVDLDASKAEASSVTALTAAVSETTAAAMASGPLNSSPTFANNANATGIPTGWQDWQNGSTAVTRVAGIAPQPYAVLITAGAGQEAGISQGMNGRLSQGWHVLEADAELVSGALTGAGGLLLWGPSGSLTSGVPVTFSTDPDVTGSAQGLGVVGRLYRWRKLININSDCVEARLYAMSHWGAHGSVAAANSIRWHRMAVRAASQAEIEARTALENSTTAAAAIIDLQEATADLEAGKASATALTTLAARVTSTETEIDDLQALNVSSRLTTAEATIVDLQETTADLEANKASATALTSLTARVSTAEGDIDGLQAINAGSRLTTAEATIVDLQETTADLATGKANATDLTSLTARVSTAEGDIDGLQAVNAGSRLTTAEATIVSLQEATADLAANKASATSVTTLASRVTTAESDIDGLQAINAGSRLTSAEAEITELQSTTADLEANKASAAAVTTLTARVSTAETDIDGLQAINAGSRLSAAEAEITDLQEATANLETGKASATDLSTLAARVTGAEGDIDGLQAVNAGSRLTTAEGNITTLQSVVVDLEAGKAEASSVTGLAAYVSDVAAAGLGNASLTTSPTFANNAQTSGPPTSWGDWNNAATAVTRVAGIAPQPYACRITSAADQNTGITQYHNGRLSKGWHVLEADVTLVSGSLSGAGIFFMWGPSSGLVDSVLLTCQSDPDVTGSAPGAGTAGKLYKWRKLFNIATDCETALMFVMGHWAGHGSISAANTVEFHKASIRPASQAEIEARQAKLDLTSVSASITDLYDVTADLEANKASASALTALSATVGSNTAGISELRTALATENSSEARLLLKVNTATNQASIEALSLSGDGTWNGSAITLTSTLLKFLAKQIFFGDDTVFEDTFNTFYTTASSKRNRWGGPFGADEDLMEWYGPTSVALNSETKQNGYWAKAVDGRMYYGGIDLGQAAGTMTLAVNDETPSYSGFGTGTKYTNSVTVTPTGGLAPYTHQWDVIDVLGADGAPFPTSASSGTTTFYADFTGSGEEFAAVIRDTVTDAAGRKAIIEVTATLQSL